MPVYYTSYKKDTINKGLNQLVDQLKSVPLNDSLGVIQDFAVKNNVDIQVTDFQKESFASIKNSNVIFGPYKSEEKTPNKSNTNTAVTTIAENNNLTSFSIKKEVKFKNDSSTYYLCLSASLQPVSEASKVLLKLLPYILICIFFIAMIGAVLYAKIISKPLIEINKIAKEMVNMNFALKCKVGSKDEIGELAQSLNVLTVNLEKSMNDLKESNKKLKSDIDREREIEGRRREFLATISHELKTPITVLKGQLEGMIYNVGIYKDREKYLKHSLQVVDNMGELVIEFLNICKMESMNFMKNSIDLQDICLNKMVNNCIQNISFMAEQKNIKLISNIEDNVIAQVNGKLIYKAFSNIIGNAITHSPNNSVVKVNLKKVDSTIIFEVKNSDVRIEEKEILKIFDAFYRVDKSRSRKTGGSGLGLYIVKMVFELHNIKYKIENTDDGVKFNAIFTTYNI